jgi:hypothetical protein
VTASQVAGRDDLVATRCPRMTPVARSQVVRHRHFVQNVAPAPAKLATVTSNITIVHQSVLRVLGWRKKSGMSHLARVEIGYDDSKASYESGFPLHTVFLVAARATLHRNLPCPRSPTLVAWFWCESAVPAGWRQVAKNAHLRITHVTHGPSARIKPVEQKCTRTGASADSNGAGVQQGICTIVSA